MPRLDPAVAEVRGAVRRCLAGHPPGSRVLVACSGGADSMSLAAATCFEGRRAGWVVSAVVVDHQLQDGSGALAARVAERLRRLGCDQVYVVPVDVGTAGGPEAAARQARHRAIREVAAANGGADAWTVLLGHTLDDQAETVLMRLARGSGTRSVGGIPARQGSWRRPLLGVRRDITRRACAAEGVEVWQDPHNSDESYTRVRVRRHVLPALEHALGPGVVEALGRTAEAAREDADLLDTQAARLRLELQQAGGLDAAALLDAPRALRRRVLRMAALEAGSPAGELFAVHVDEVERLLTDWHGQQEVQLPGHVVVRRQDGRLYTTGADRRTGS